MPVDYRQLLIKYAQAVVDDDHIVGLGALEPEDDDEYSDEERRELMLVQEQVWPTDFFGPWSETKYRAKIEATRAHREAMRVPPHRRQEQKP